MTRTSFMTRTIKHNTTDHRFEYYENGLLCRLDYRLDPPTMHLLHTGVPAALGGQGIAADLLKAALKTAQSNNWKVKSHCSYIDHFFSKNPSYQFLLA